MRSQLGLFANLRPAKVWFVVVAYLREVCTIVYVNHDDIVCLLVANGKA